MSAIPAHCPYQQGDRVQMHGFPGYHAHDGQHLNDYDVSGFRGTVEGYIGATILTGHTDGGRAWAEEWGHLDPDGTRCHDARCGCCPHPGGVCQPQHANPDRARQAARDMAAWLHAGGPHPRLLAARRDLAEFGPPVQYGQLTLFAS